MRPELVEEKSLKIRLSLKPGQKGTKALTEKYGKDLLCIRFRYDAILRQRLKTVELVIERMPWTPTAPAYSADALVPLRIKITDYALRRQAKAAEGRWDPEKKLWYAKYNRIAGTELEKHIYVDDKD